MVTKGKVIFERVVLGSHGFAFLVKMGQILRVTDLEGRQIVDFICFNEKNHSEKLSTCRSMIMSRQSPGAKGVKIKLGKGDILYSNVFNPMFTIVENTSGSSDIFYSQCNRHLWEPRQIPTGAPSGRYHGCFEIMTDALKDWGLTEYDIPCPFNINQNSDPDMETGLFHTKPTPSKPGDYTELRAEMNCLVAVSACPYRPIQEGTEIIFRSAPIKIEVVEPPESL